MDTMFDQIVLKCGLRRYLKIDRGQEGRYIDMFPRLLDKNCTLDIFKLDDYLHYKFGEYETERDLSMAELIECEYGPDARKWVEENI